MLQQAWSGVSNGMDGRNRIAEDGGCGCTLLCPEVASMVLLCLVDVEDTVLPTWL